MICVDDEDRPLPQVLLVGLPIMHILLTYLVLMALVVGCTSNKPKPPIIIPPPPVKPPVVTPKPPGPDLSKCFHYKDGVVIGEGDVAVAKRPAYPGAIGYKDGMKSYYSWPGGRVAYAFEPGFEGKAFVSAAINHYHMVSKIKFVPRTTEPDYIVFKNGNGCWSFIGRIRGPQDISLGTGCETRAAIHELGHALGLWHEQTRADRDKYVKVLWQNIEPTQVCNFAQNTRDTSDIGTYDFSSIMHYGYWGFSKNGEPTITKLDGSTTGFGESDSLSPADIAAVNAINP